jgi:hypothetical protein
VSESGLLDDNKGKVYYFRLLFRVPEEGGTVGSS